MKGRQYDYAGWSDLTSEARRLRRRYPMATLQASRELLETVRKVIETQVGAPVSDDLVIRVARRAVIDTRPPRANGGRWPDGSGSREPRRPIIPSLGGCIEVPVPDDDHADMPCATSLSVQSLLRM